MPVIFSPNEKEFMPDKLAVTANEALDPGGLLPGTLYAEVKKRITRSLMDGEWPQDAAIPTESQFAQRYAVSVGTVRKAIGELVSEHVLVRRRGVGTFVASRNRDYMLDAYFRIVDDQGRKEFPESRLISLRRGKADAEVARRLRIAQGAPLYRIENLLFLDGKPAIFDRIEVPQAVFHDLNESAFRRRGMTIFGFYQTRFGVTVTRLEEWVRATSAEAKLAGLLGIKSGEAVLAIERVAYTYDGTPVELRHRRVSTRSHAYFSVLGMKRV